MALLESQRGADAGVRRRIIVGVAVVVDIADIRGRARVNRQLPPVAARTNTTVNQRITIAFFSYQIFLLVYYPPSSILAIKRLLS